MESTPFRCPTCGSTALEPTPEGTLLCLRCGSVSEVAGQVCPDCGTANPPEAGRCEGCGRVLDPVLAVLERQRYSPRERREILQHQIAQLREEAEVASQERLRRWWAEEVERRRALAQARAERERRERQGLMAAMILGAVVLLLLLAYAVTTFVLTTPTPTPTPL